MTGTTTSETLRVPVGLDLQRREPFYLKLSSTPHISVSGRAGFGKTALLAKIAKWGLEHGFEIVWLDAEHDGPTEHDLVDSVKLRTLGKRKNQRVVLADQELFQHFEPDLQEIIEVVQEQRSLFEVQGGAADGLPFLKPLKLVIIENFPLHAHGSSDFERQINWLLRNGDAAGVHLLIGVKASETGLGLPGRMRHSCLGIEMTAWTAQKATAVISTAEQPLMPRAVRIEWP